MSTKLFGDDLPKHLKDMSEAKKAGQQMQKPYSNSSNRGAVHSQKRNFRRFKPTSTSTYYICVQKSNPM